MLIFVCNCWAVQRRTGEGHDTGLIPSECGSAVPGRARLLRRFADSSGIKEVTKVIHRSESGGLMVTFTEWGQAKQVLPHITSTTTDKKCAAYGGSHSSSDRECPKWREESRIANLRRKKKRRNKNKTTQKNQEKQENEQQEPDILTVRNSEFIDLYESLPDLEDQKE
ncbi:hypothetical protein Hamer_G003139 [Homarus americanus]|uniref:Uncharacterized protein n=1 Tax=Homarus americanus TaxID=6706 RepID=A0A8J5N6Q9_HOMAM|nr:hypothetical protein Hamer_G003139 [Homarus americanus]